MQATTSDTAIRALAGRDADGRTVVLVVNTSDVETSWTPTDADGRVLAGDFELTTVDDAHTGAWTSTASFPIALPPYGVELLAPADR